MNIMYDLTGKTINNLFVIKRVENTKSGNTRWLCKCICGKEFITNGTAIRIGHTKSCGCLRKEKTSGKNCILYKHGLYRTRLYKTWHNMIQRCSNKNNIHFKNYGGRGIKVCDDWKNDFLSFYNWAINNGYKDNLTIDRIDVNGNYEPSNCRWVTMKEQSNNRTSNHLITFNNETHNMMEWSKITRD